MGFRLMMNGKAIDPSLVPPCPIGGKHDWTKALTEEIDNLHEATCSALSISSDFCGQPVDVWDEEFKTVTARVSMPSLLASEGPPDALDAPLELPEGSVL